MEPPEHAGAQAPAPAVPPPQRYGRWVGVLAVVILILITINTIVTKPNGATGVAPGSAIPPFAVPLVTGDRVGAPDVATHPDEGQAGRVPACRLREPGVLNLCELYEGAPVALALFVDGGSCPQVLSDMQSLSAEFPGVRFAAVAIMGDRAALRRLVRSRGLTFPVGVDESGVLAALYKVASCPQVTLAYPGGTVAGRPLLGGTDKAVLRARLTELVAGARARGWRGGGA
jgi:hypothetical protein